MERSNNRNCGSLQSTTIFAIFHSIDVVESGCNLSPNLTPLNPWVGLALSGVSCGWHSNFGTQINVKNVLAKIEKKKKKVNKLSERIYLKQCEC